MDTNKMREQFEKAWTLMSYPDSEGLDDPFYLSDFSLNPQGEYLEPIIHYAWWGWQASRATAVVELPTKACIRTNEYTPYEVVDVCRDAIEAQGLKVAP